MAYLRQQKNGRWQAVVKRKGYPEKSQTFALQADAANWAKSIELEMDRGTWADDKHANVLLSELLARYRDTVLPTKKGRAPDASRL